MSEMAKAHETSSIYFLLWQCGFASRPNTDMIVTIMSANNGY